MARSDHQSKAEAVLPRSTKELLVRVSDAKKHAGLQLDKLSSGGKMELQKPALLSVAEFKGDVALLLSLLERRAACLESVNAIRFEMKTRGPLTLHLSRSGVFENAGIALHPIYGFVHLPGQGLKGMARAWAETQWAAQQPDSERAWRRIEQAFGWSERSESKKQNWRPDSIGFPNGSAAGRIVFHDAWPARWPRLELDIVNNHHWKYYGGECDPGDWEDPNLAYFLAIGADETFEFALSDRFSAPDGLLNLAQEWLAAALTDKGAGAKTNAGYGRFSTADGSSLALPGKISRPESYELRLATPAFLAGAYQERKDCDLRSATLRGLLRWWWRTMHAAHVDRENLARMESAIWGNSQAGAAVGIALESVLKSEPIKHLGKHDKNFLDQHDIRHPIRRKKVIQGLYYASYGMAEEKLFRWVMPEGAIWRLCMTARNSSFRPGQSNVAAKKIPSSLVLEQARASLWLMARFGGAGSRSRKGFGSFNDVGVVGIASIEDCRAAALRFRETCGLPENSRRTLKSPALEDVILLERSTPWQDPWFALDQIGEMMQLFVKECRGDERMALGLPRSVGKERRQLVSGGIKRHASPAHWSVCAGNDGSLILRLAAFPSARLPNYSESGRILKNLASFAEQQLREQAQQRRGSVPRGPAGADNRSERESRQARKKSPGPEKGSYVDAVLLKERTKGGGWRARHEPSGIEMQIFNTNDVPGECEPGDVVELRVFSNNAFQWPTDEVRQKAKPKPRSGGSRRNDRKKGRRS